jgi:hypothetical protein
LVDTQQLDSSLVVQMLVGDGIVIILPFVVGWVCARGRAARRVVVVLGVAAQGLTILGLLYLTDSFTLGLGDPGMNGVGAFLVGCLCSFVGLLLAFASCGSALTYARRSGRRGWVLLLLLAALLPLLATVGVVNYLILVALRLYPGKQEVFESVLLAFHLAPVGCVALLIFGVVALFGPREGRPAAR